MTPLYDTNVSKFLSYVLRHKPESIGLTLDENGWASIEEIVAKSEFTREQIILAINHNEKQRFLIDHTTDRVRANQGHTISVDLQLKKAIPPPILYHGTVEKYLASIKKEGLKPMTRQHVHLSATIETATMVASRRGKPIILIINTRKLVKNKHPFYLSENGVWLTEFIPPESISQ